jgi:hypothetical protein
MGTRILDQKNTSIHRLKKFTLGYITVTRLRPHTVPAAEYAVYTITGTVWHIQFIQVRCKKAIEQEARREVHKRPQHVSNSKFM